MDCFHRNRKAFDQNPYVICILAVAAIVCETVLTAWSSTAFRWPYIVLCLDVFINWTLMHPHQEEEKTVTIIWLLAPKISSSGAGNWSVVLEEFHREPVYVDNNVCWQQKKRKQIAKIEVSLDSIQNKHPSIRHQLRDEGSVDERDPKEDWNEDERVCDAQIGLQWHFTEVT